ncbi:formimidoyltetrahydrofolate cyclodeaminase [Rubrobacter marinus]|uniref:Formimidoyltetrahydrofolate cyclodeaminase n=1 Tax=Rubrobacter marinus TaxID=2653852 RepID=A0A6G8PX54_9ACTN|nr:cyclodeaminase/cyclohydrolase family protein [Rubrobacter marinus]QIN78776.1 formimidoyltetrahydrofolate cyclodeaminase [Rubrobacter marinus]
MNAEDPTPDYPKLPLERFLDLTASREPAPAGGSAAAVTVALAAALTGMAARFSDDHLAEADELAARADFLGEEASGLARADAAAYARVLEARRSPRDPELRRRRVGEALSEAAGVPLAVAEAGAEIAGLAARLAREGNPNLRGDAVCAALLAEAGTRAAVTLAKINLSAAGLYDGCVERAGELARTAAAHALGAEERADVANVLQGRDRSTRPPSREGRRQGGRR